MVAMPPLVDTHCHLDWRDYRGEEEAVVARAHAAGVTRMVTIGTELETSRAAVALAQRFAGAGVYAVVGIHPNDTAGFTDATLAGVRALAGAGRVVAIGEIGLDYYWKRVPAEQQARAFRAQLALAAELELPVVIHSRDAMEATLVILGAKLALHLRREGYRPMLVAADVYRPAAIEQLKSLGRQLDIPVYDEGVSSPPPQIASNGVLAAAKDNRNVVIVDTAGRLQIDEDMMQEVATVRERTKPKEVLLVADSMTGQEAVNIAQGFNEKVGLTGLILTKVDGDARGGAAISMREVTGVPIKFLGTSEKTDGLEVFHPDRMANRILGMGDVLSLIERAESMEMDEGEAEALALKMQRNELTLEDFRKQLKQIKRMGPLTQVMEMIPGMGDALKQVKQEDVDRQLQLTEAIINSMTVREREHPKVLNASRRKRIAAGSGTSVTEVNQLLNQFQQMQKMMKKLTNSKRPNDIRNLFR